MDDPIAREQFKERIRGRFREHRFRGDPRARARGGMVGGLILAGIGLLLLLQNLGIPFFDDLEKFWPVILIIVGTVHAARSFSFGGRIWGAGLIMAGMLFLLRNFEIIHVNLWRFVWPGILILIGLAMLARGLDRHAWG